MEDFREAVIEAKENLTLDGMARVLNQELSKEQVNMLIERLYATNHD